MPKRVEEVRLRMDRLVLADMKSPSIREDSPDCWGRSREGVVGEEGVELVEVGVSS